MGPTCRHRLVEVGVQLGEVTLTMHACSTCDRSWWDRDGEPVELGAVLALASAVSDHARTDPSGAPAPT